MPPIRRPSTNPLRGAIPAPLRGLTDAVFPPDELPMPGGVTIGPKAIPLADEDTYLKTVLSKVFPDFAEVGEKYLGRAGGAPQEGVNTIMGAAMGSPAMTKLVGKQMALPKAARESMMHRVWDAPHMKDGIRPAIDALASIMAGITPK